MSYLLIQGYSSNHAWLYSIEKCDSGLCVILKPVCIRTYITAGTIHGKRTVSTIIVNMLHALKLLTPAPVGPADYASIILSIIGQ